MQRLKSFIIIAFWACFATSGFAQSFKQEDRGFYYDYDKQFISEFYFLPCGQDNSNRLLVLYKFSSNLLQYQIKRENNSSYMRLISEPTLDYEFRNSDGIIKSRLNDKKTYFSKSNKAGQGKKTYKKGFFWDTLAFSKYTASVDMRDRHSNPIFQEKYTDLKTFDYNKNNCISNPLFVTINGEDSSRYYPLILNGNISFSQGNIYCLMMASYKDENTVYKYSIKNNVKKNKENNWGNVNEIIGKVSPIRNTEFNTTFLEEPNNVFITLNKFESKKSNNIGLLKLNMHIDKLLPGSYTLDIYQDGAEDTTKYEFDVVWDDIPNSLRNVDYAMKMMYYTLTDKQYDSIKTGNEKEIFEKIVDYWKYKDPTPNTTFNEAMAEYFRRVDYAFYNYQNIYEKDGAQTDMGKIYILYGSPNKNDRVLEGNDATEKWVYDKLKQIFIFESQSGGTFKLKKIDDIK